VSISVLRQQLSEGGPGALQVLEQLSTHRLRPSKPSPVPYHPEILSTFPNILKVYAIHTFRPLTTAALDPQCRQQSTVPLCPIDRPQSRRDHDLQQLFLWLWCHHE
jgi:hypothetical protein